MSIRLLARALMRQSLLLPWICQTKYMLPRRSLKLSRMVSMTEGYKMIRHQAWAAKIDQVCHNSVSQKLPSCHSASTYVITFNSNIRLTAYREPQTILLGGIDTQNHNPYRDPVHSGMSEQLMIPNIPRLRFNRPHPILWLYNPQGQDRPWWRRAR